MYIDAIKSAPVAGKPDDLEADRTKVRDYIANLNGFQGFAGAIHFNEDGDAVKSFFVVQGENGAWTTKVTACSAEGAC
jgi:branched-chain amino acid transport system substrate-binding protein